MPGGRPQYEPSDADRQTVRLMIAAGYDHLQVARCIAQHGIAPKTLRKHFRRELDVGLIEANSAVAKRAYEMAEAGDPPAATFFWLKCRCGWRETQQVEHSGPGGGKLEVVFVKPPEIAE
jgi:hypothetical protein